MIRWTQILLAIVEWEAPIFPSKVAAHFQLNPKECPRRLQVLHQWGMLRYVDRSKRGHGGYEVTEYGRAKAEEIRKGGNAGEGAKGAG